ncbi:hypothetical protein D3C73_1265580 [compost metagenome]
MFGDDVFGGLVAVVDGGMSIARQYHVIAQFQGLAHGGVDAVIRLQATDDQALEVLHR